MVQMRHKAAFTFSLTPFGTRARPSVDVYPDKRDSYTHPIPPTPHTVPYREGTTSSFEGRP